MATAEVEATKESLGMVIKKNDTLTKVVRTQLEQYLNLREQAMMVASRARELQGRADTLTYAEGVMEVKRVMAGLVDDLQEREMKALMREAGFNFEGAVRLLSDESAKTASDEGEDLTEEESTEWSDDVETTLASLSRENVQFHWTSYVAGGRGRPY
ncbi:MAG: hypothetical protein Q9218_001581 [Villophora microphyllina]